jgi:DNA segregation ATPase FtsK/SpoIIIE-like protein
MEDQKRLLSILLEAARIYCGNVSDTNQRLTRIEQALESIQESLDCAREYDEKHGTSHIQVDGQLDLSRSPTLDRLAIESMDMFVESNMASVSLVQRRFRVGYTRAARTVDELERQGLIGPHAGSRARVLLVDAEEWREVRQVITPPSYPTAE